MSDNTYRECDKCGYVFKLGNTVSKYLDKHGCNIYCPLCNETSNHRITKIEYDKIKNSRNWYNK